jgi:hypothetical protein
MESGSYESAERAYPSPSGALSMSHSTVVNALILSAASSNS